MAVTFITIKITKSSLVVAKLLDQTIVALELGTLSIKKAKDKKITLTTSRLYLTYPSKTSPCSSSNIKKVFLKI